MWTSKPARLLRPIHCDDSRALRGRGGATTQRHLSGPPRSHMLPQSMILLVFQRREPQPKKA
jgi:hypothetical protein